MGSGDAVSMQQGEPAEAKEWGEEEGNEPEGEGGSKGGDTETTHFQSSLLNTARS